MPLHYLDFDASDDDAGRCSFDAMASLVPARVPAMLDEVAAVLRWAIHGFGPAAALDDGGEWDYDLQAVAEPRTPLAIVRDAATGLLLLPAAPAGTQRITLTFTLTGSPAFCDAFRAAFEPAC